MTIKTKEPSGFQTEVTMNKQQRDRIQQWAVAMMGNRRMASGDAAKALADFVGALDYREITPTAEALGWTAREAKRMLRPKTYYRLYRWRRVREGIEAVCKVSGSSHFHLANLLGVDDAQLSRWYNGKSEPNPKHREKLEKALASMGWLREGERLW